MSELFNIAKIDSCCQVCLKESSDVSQVTLFDQFCTTANRIRDLLTEVFLKPFSLVKSEEMPSYRICQSCCLKLEDVHYFRNQCTEVYQFYTAVDLAKSSSSELPLVKLLEEKDNFSLLGHLEQLGIVSRSDLTIDEILVEIGFVKEKTYNEQDDAASNSDVKDFKSQDSVIEPTGSYVSDSSDDKPLVTMNRKIGAPKQVKSIERVDTCAIPDCKELLGKQRFADHLKESHIYGCKECGLALISKYTMAKHVTLHVNKPPSVKCSFCDRMFSSVAKMRCHAIDVHLQRPNNYECEECEEKFESRKLLNAHRVNHLPKNCSVCQLNFDTSYKLLYHITKHHPKQLLRCRHCSRKFLNQSLFDRHTLEHSETVENTLENGYELLTVKKITLSTCLQCSKQFITEAHKQAHMSTHDPASRPKVIIKKRSKEELNKLEYKYHCNQCNASYRLPKSLESHMKAHTTTPFVCDICGASLKTKTYLQQHITYRHSKDFRYICDFCPKAFATSSDLQRHRRVHTNERPYKCDQCEARFKTNDGYRKHLRSHSGEKIYRCDLCDRSFMCHSSLKTHKTSHTNEKPLKCFYCEQHFNVHKNRRRHILRLHPGLPTREAPG
ncbi:zinc finger protein 479-like [Malaya genurostris]|uniref:zinc finger protein 479-like n=1 Tax=Malaya genurostris TaxID=325434 RepID=UPI0026F38DE7|nr:zinc finger protein 479-like [Malaya genurostris]